MVNLSIHDKTRSNKANRRDCHYFMPMLNVNFIEPFFRDTNSTL